MPHVVTAAKGIYKPRDFEYALTVRQTLDSPYADRPVIPRPDGGWVYGYHQEGSDPAARDDDFTNVALMRNIDAEVPVAVLMQTSSKPKVRYRVLGLALVTRWQDGFFYLEGFADDGTAAGSGTAAEDAVVRAAASQAVDRDDGDDLDPGFDARVRVAGSIVRRSGQAAFRRALLEAYGYRCAVTGCEVAEVLDAAHILPYRGEHTNSVTNGLLLRTDIHTLFDLGLLAIDPDHRNVILAMALREGEYGRLHGSALAEPTDSAHRPSTSALVAHLDWCGDRLGADALRALGASQ